MDTTQADIRLADFEEIRASHGDTQFSVAVKAGLSLATVQRFETGKAQTLTPRSIRKLAEGYSVSLDLIRSALASSQSESLKKSA